LRRLSKLLADPLVAGLDPTALKEVTGEHLAVIAKSDWAELAQLVSPDAPHPQAWVGVAARWLTRGRRFVDRASGRARHRRVIDELALVRRSVEAEFQLRDMLAASESSKPEAAITPLNPSWQLSSQAIQEVVRHILLDQPKLVVECGSGAATVWIGRALRRVGVGRVIALENSEDGVAIVSGLLQHEGLSSVEIRHAPMEPIQVAGREQPWYSASAIADVEEIDLLLVDGPAGRTNKLARYPAVPALCDKLRPGATVMLDDCHRRDEKETVRRWLNEVPRLSWLRQVDHLAVMKIN
jgi:predicted O-methyltransferase YrrM